MKRIDLGAVGFKHPDFQGILFGSEEAVTRKCEKEGKDPSKAGPVDTRPSLKQVLEQIRARENEACGLYGNGARFSVGPWEEYFHVSKDDEVGELWPQNYSWLAAYVVRGASEGLYLHISVIDSDDKHRILFIGKTLLSNEDAWERCYESAGRIAWYLS